MSGTSIVVIGLLAISGLPGAVQTTAPVQVPVCITRMSDRRAAVEAQRISSLMFQNIGIRIAWRQGLGGCDPGAIRIAVSERTPSTLRPGAMAYALPFAGFRALTGVETGEDFHIQVFYDRVDVRGDSLAPRLLAHVLTHEIVHVLQGVTRHSSEGLMKACWSEHDYAVMMLRQLVLTPDDIELVQLGMVTRGDLLKAREKLPTEREIVSNVASRQLNGEMGSRADRSASLFSLLSQK